MAITVTPGVTFQQGGGQEYTAAQMNTAFTGMAITGISRENMASTTRPVTVSASAPATPQVGELWMDTSTNLLKVYNGTSWAIVGPSIFTPLTAQSSIAGGDVVVFDTGAALSVETTTTAGALAVAGVSRETVSSSASVLIQTEGVVTLNCTEAEVAIGDRLATSATAGRAASATSGNVFAIALSSKAGGSVGQVSAYLMGVQANPSLFSTSFSTYSMTATLTNGTFYDFPNAALGSVTAPTNGGSTSMKLSVTTTRANQAVTLTMTGLDIRTDDVNDFFKGFRLVAQNSGASDTVILGSTTKDDTAWRFTNGDGKEESHACGAAVYRITNVLVGIRVAGSSITFTLPTADTYTLRPQFQALNASSTSYIITNVTAATFVAVVH